MSSDTSGTADDSARRAGRFIVRRFDRLAKDLREHGAYVGTGHKRILIPKSKLTETDVSSLGFVPVTIAIPEAGQDRFQSFRHPDSLFHLHSHPEGWTMHEDEHHASTMLMRKEKSTGGKASAFIKGIPHVSDEGLPGLYYYVKGLVSGGESTAQRVAKEIPSHVRRRINRWADSPTHEPMNKTALAPALLKGLTGAGIGAAGGAALGAAAAEPGSRMRGALMGAGLGAAAGGAVRALPAMRKAALPAVPVRPPTAGSALTAAPSSAMGAAIKAAPPTAAVPVPSTAAAVRGMPTAVQPVHSPSMASSVPAPLPRGSAHPTAVSAAKNQIAFSGLSPDLQGMVTSSDMVRKHGLTPEAAMQLAYMSRKPGEDLAGTVSRHMGSAKLGFATSQFSGDLGPGAALPYASGIPPFRVPELKKAQPKTAMLAAMADELVKLNGMALSPASRLSSAQQVGGPRVTARSGPSIATISKPKGFGTPLSGTTAS